MKTLFLFLFFLFQIAFATQKKPEVHIEEGCKCIECPYYHTGDAKGAWTAQKNMELFATPESTKVVATLKSKERAVAIGGEVRTLPGILEVIYPRNRYEKGDEVYILSEDADAGYKVWHKGVEDIEDLSIMVSTKEPCKTASKTCWAKVQRPLVSVWWVQLQLKNKIKGWTKSVDDFDFDKTSCF